MSATPQQQRQTDESHSPGGETASDTESLPLDQVFEVLKNSRRREVLKYLHECESSVSLSDLAEHVAAIENDTTVKALSSSQRKRVYVGLYQCHLPKMDDMDIVDFDQNRGRIELAANAGQLDEYLDADTEQNYWHHYYASTSLFGAGLFVLSHLGAASVGLTPSVVLVALVLATLAIAGLEYCEAHGQLERVVSKLPALPRLPVGQRS
jgi:DNA-binding transcriptional ArsR family regulator